MYVLKSIPEFIYSRRERISIKYGKDFEYNPVSDYFSIEDESIINFVEEYINIDQTLYKDSKVDISLIDGKYLNILESGLKNFLRNIRNKEIIFNYDDKVYKTYIKNNDIDISFHINEDGNKLVLSSNSKDISLLNAKGDVVLLDSEIYLISDKQCYNYVPFHNLFTKNGSITFKKDVADSLFNGVLPVLKRASKNISFDESLESQIRNNLDVKFYFDKMKNNICQIQSNQNLTEVSIINLYLNDKIPKKYIDELQKNLNIYYNEREDYEDYENCVNLDCTLDDIIVSEDCISLNLLDPVDRETVDEEIKILTEWISVRCPGDLGIHIKGYSYEY